MRGRDGDDAVGGGGCSGGGGKKGAVQRTHGFPGCDEFDGGFVYYRYFPIILLWWRVLERGTCVYPGREADYGRSTSFKSEIGPLVLCVLSIYTTLTRQTIHPRVTTIMVRLITHNMLTCHVSKYQCVLSPS